MKSLYPKTNFVYGDGPKPCSVMIIGEAPGEEENEQRKPFVGRAGKVLTKMLEEQAKLKREQVYITNAVKQRPPENRTPTFEEIMAHRPYLMMEIKTVNPVLIVTLGKTAVCSLMEMAEVTTINRLRECGLAPIEVRYTCKTICTFHPASTFYGGGTIKAMQEDFARLGRLARRRK